MLYIINMKNFSLVYYHIPEDFDDPESPNAFGIAKAMDEIRLRDVKENFPLEGTYHFRFKYVYNKVPVWMDLNNEQAKVPQFQNKIVAKATRISWDSTPLPAEQPIPPQARPPPVVPQVPVSSSAGLNIFDVGNASVPQAKAEQQYDLLFSH
jgi:hypothetical protein